MEKLDSEPSLFFSLMEDSLNKIPLDNKKLAIIHNYAKRLFEQSQIKPLKKLLGQSKAIPLNESTKTNHFLLLQTHLRVYTLQQDFDSAYQVIDQLKALAGQFQDTIIQIKVLREQSAFMKKNGDVTNALKLLLEALGLAEVISDTMSIAVVKQDIAMVYEKVNKSGLAIQYNLEALELFRKFKDVRSAARIYNNLGLVYNELRRYDSAEYYYQLSKNISDSLDVAFGVAVTTLNIGLIAYHKKEYDRGIKLFNEVLPYFERISDEYGICLCYLNLCRIYNDTRNTEKALELGLAGIRIAKEKNYVNEIRALSDELSSLYEQLGDYRNALKYKKEEIIAKDSLFNQEKDYEIGKLESKIDLDQAIFQKEIKQKENEILKENTRAQKAQINLQNGIIIAVIFGLLLLVIILFLLRKQSIERKKLLDKIRHQSEKLKELDHAKTRFFANISHDLRSPLTLILGALDRINEREYDILDRDTRELLETGIKNGKRLLYLADEIMDLTRLEEGKIELKFQYVKIVPYLRLLTKMFSSAADMKNISLEFINHCEDETILKLDPHQFEKIIYNLLSNAIKFTPNEGSVKVSLHPGNEEMGIQVADSGPGIPEEKQPYVFDRYYQAGNHESGPQAGVGIGLALVKELTELHQGEITFSSTQKGTTFLVRFPFKRSDWISSAIIPERSLDIITRNSLWMDLQSENRHQFPGIAQPLTNAKTILIVEDHRELRTYLKATLIDQYRIFEASHGSAALDILHSETIDLVITDLMMPYMDGFEMIDQLKKDKALLKIPILVLSARTGQSEKLDLLSKGAEDVMHKPFDREELLIRVNKLLESDWDNSRQLKLLYNETIGAYEKEVMRKLEQLILNRIDDPHLSVLDLADEMAASERKVYRLIKKISGLTPYELIKEIRWQYLENYLKKNPVKTATEAARLIGMSNPSSLSAQYQKRFGRMLKEDLTTG